MFGSKRKSIARRGVPSSELMDYMAPFEPHYLEIPFKRN